jgi:hypothetical protein
MAFILDDYSDGRLGFALFKLRTAYGGSCIRVRRSNDNAETDIGFDGNGNLDTAAIASHVGANSGFVVTWYDQGAAGKNATQSTTANQPRIVNAGTLEVQNGLPSLFFDGSNDNLIFTAETSNTNWSSFITGKRTASGNIGLLLGSNASGATPLAATQWSDNNIYIQTANATGANNLKYKASSSTDTSATFNIIESYNNALTLSAYKNGSSISLGSTLQTTAAAASFGLIGRYNTGGSTYSNGYISSVIFFNADKTSDRADIYEDLRSYYFDTPVSATGIASGTTVGTATVTPESADTPVTATGIASGTTVGTAEVTLTNTPITATGISSATATGTATVVEQVDTPVTATGISSGTSVGTATVAEVTGSTVRFEAECAGLLADSQWKVQIIDLEHEGATTEMELAAPYFELRWESEGDELHTEIKASSADIHIFTSSPRSNYEALEGFYSELITASEGRYFVKIYRGDSNTDPEYALHWAGRLLTDAVQWEDSDPYTFVLTATDGLGILQNKNYKAAENTPFTGADTFVGMLTKALAQTGIAALYESTDPFLDIAAEWYNSAMPSTAATYPVLENTRTNHATWWQAAEQSRYLYKYMKTYDVLRSILRGWGARIIMSEGRYRVVQLGLYQKNSAKYATYSTDGTQLSTGTYSGTDWRAQLDFEQIRQLAGGQYTYHAALKRVVVPYAHKGSNNRLSNAPNYISFNIGAVPGGTNAGHKIRLQGIIRLQVWNRTAAIVTNCVPVWNINLSLGSGPTNRLLKPWNSDQVTWTTGAGNYQLHSGNNNSVELAPGASTELLVPFNFTTPEIPAESNSSNFFTFTQAGWVNFLNQSTSLTDGVEISLANNWQDAAYANKVPYRHRCIYFQAVVLPFGEEPSEYSEIVVENAAAGGYENSDELTLDPTDFGDTMNGKEPGRLQVWDGAAWVDATAGEWEANALDGALTFTDLLATELADQYRSPLKVKVATLYRDYPVWKMLRVGNNIINEYMVWNGGTFTAATDDLQGEWIVTRARSRAGVMQNVADPSLFPPSSAFPWVTIEPVAQYDNQMAALFGLLGMTVTEGALTEGAALTQIPIVAPNHTGFKTGMEVNIYNPKSGTVTTVTLTADVGAADTLMNISSTTLPNDIAGGSYVMLPQTQIADVLGHLYEGTFTGIEGWTPSLNTSSPNNTVNASRMLASGGSTNQDAVIQPKGTGALLAQLPDGTSAGGNKRGAYAVDLQMGRSAATQVASGASSFIGAGQSNTSSGNRSVSVGGFNNTSTQQDSVVVGGASNNATATRAAIVAGQGNDASGSDSFIGAGSTNDATAANSAVAAGSNNIASGAGAFIGGGSRNTASGTNSGVLSGAWATANKTGMVAHAASRFSANGDNQREYYELSKITTDETPTILTADNAAPDSTNTIAIESGACYTYEVKAIGKDVSSGDIISHVEAGWVKNIGGTITKNKHYGYTDNELTPADLVVKDNDTDDRLDIEVTGESGKTIRWGATVTMRKVK